MAYVGMAFFRGLVIQKGPFKGDPLSFLQPSKPSVEFLSMNEISKNLPGQLMGGPSSTINGVDNNGGITEDDLTALIQKVRQPEWLNGQDGLGTNEIYSVAKLLPNLKKSTVNAWAVPALVDSIGKRMNTQRSLLTLKDFSLLNNYIAGTYFDEETLHNLSNAIKDIEEYYPSHINPATRVRYTPEEAYKETFTVQSPWSNQKANYDFYKRSGMVLPTGDELVKGGKAQTLSRDNFGVPTMTGTSQSISSIPALLQTSGFGVPTILEPLQTSGFGVPTMTESTTLPVTTSSTNFGVPADIQQIMDDSISYNNPVAPTKVWGLPFQPVPSTIPVTQSGSRGWGVPVNAVDYMGNTSYQTVGGLAQGTTY